MILGSLDGGRIAAAGLSASDIPIDKYDFNVASSWMPEDETNTRFTSLNRYTYFYQNQNFIYIIILYIFVTKIYIK